MIEREEDHCFQIESGRFERGEKSAASEGQGFGQRDGVAGVRE